jgi:hypothetical protein
MDLILKFGYINPKIPWKTLIRIVKINLKHTVRFLRNNQVKNAFVSMTHPDDMEKARSIKEINEFKTKPMTEDMLKEIINENFPGYI